MYLTLAVADPNSRSLTHASEIFFGMRYSGILRERGLHHLRISLRHDVQAGCWGRNITRH
jgi:hypothetical protein